MYIWNSVESGVKPHMTNLSEHILYIIGKSKYLKHTYMYMYSCLILIVLELAAYYINARLIYHFVLF